MLFLSLFAHNINAVLMYDHQALLDLQFSANNLVKLDYGGHKTLSPFLSGIPAHLCRALVPPLQHKCPHRWGKCSRQLVRLKASMASLSTAFWTQSVASYFYFSVPAPWSLLSLSPLVRCKFEQSSASELGFPDSGHPAAAGSCQDWPGKR